MISNTVIFYSETKGNWYGYATVLLYGLPLALSSAKADHNSDPSRQQVYKTWLVAAGVAGIPAAFVIDKEGKISWVGHPAVGEHELEAVVDQVIKGDVDLAAMRQEELVTYERDKTYRTDDELRALTQDLLEQKKYEDLAKSGEKYKMESDEQLKGWGESQLFLASLFLTPKEGRDQLKALLNKQFQGSVPVIRLITRYADLLPRDVVDTTIAKLANGGDMSLDDLSEIHYKIGDYKQAVNDIEKYITFLQKRGGANPKYIEALELRRDKYAAGKTD